MLTMLAATSAYQPFQPARRPGGKPDARPRYRVLVHRRFERQFAQMVERVGLAAAQEFWDHVSTDPGAKPATASTCILRGQAGRPISDGWSRTVHYELASAARIDYQFNNAYKTGDGADPHPVVAILTICYSSH
jgi:hypothetical protein